MKLYPWQHDMIEASAKQKGGRVIFYQPRRFGMTIARQQAKKAYDAILAASKEPTK